MFCKSGILSLSLLRITKVYMHTPCWLKHLCSIRALVPVSFFLSLTLFLWSAEALWVHFPARASKTLSRRHSVPSPHWEGAWGLREQSKPCAGALLAFCVNQRISASFSLLYFLINRLWTTRFRSVKGPQHSSETWRKIPEETAKTGKRLPQEAWFGVGEEFFFITSFAHMIFKAVCIEASDKNKNRVK